MFSHAERIKCLKGAPVITATPNQTRSGARMLTDFVEQATAVSAYLSAQPAPRYVPILLGQNDVCGGEIFKYHLSCDAGADQDRNNYCRTAPGAFERELRKGLDILMSVPDTHVGAASLVRVSQLCNHAGKRNCQTFTSCRDLWSAAAFAGVFVGRGSGLCGSLTASCSESRYEDNAAAVAFARIYKRFFPDFFAFAQRSLASFERRARTSADKRRRRRRRRLGTARSDAAWRPFRTPPLRPGNARLIEAISASSAWIRASAPCRARVRSS